MFCGLELLGSPERRAGVTWECSTVSCGMERVSACAFIRDSLLSTEPDILVRLSSHCMAQHMAP